MIFPEGRLFFRAAGLPRGKKLEGRGSLFLTVSQADQASYGTCR